MKLFLAPQQARLTKALTMSGVAIMSTRHITLEDNKLLQFNQCPRQIGVYDYGYVLRCTDPEAGMRDWLVYDMSQAFVDLMFRLHGLGFNYVFLDQAADVCPDFQTFDW